MNNYNPSVTSSIVQHEDMANAANSKELHPVFDPLEKPETFIKHISDLTKQPDAVPHKKLLKEMLEQVQPIDYRAAANLDNKERIPQKVHTVITVQETLCLATKLHWALCVKHDKVYLYNGAFWKHCPDADFCTFLGQVAEKMGIPQTDARYHRFRDELFKQFISVANLPTPEPQQQKVIINMQNGTFEITPDRQYLRKPDPADFLTYRLPYSYDPEAVAPTFHRYLEQVLPYKSLQEILSEYLGYVFVHPTTLRLEKALLLYGNGANGKSVLFQIVFALLGKENILSHSLYNLTDRKTGYHRADLATKLLNYTSELDGISDRSIFKAIVSCENIEARPIYGRPFNFVNTCKLIFNCNGLPKETEQTHAFFRRFLIIPFTVTIPDHEQDKKLADKIIAGELPGVFNWILDGLQRLLRQQGFTHSDVAENALKEYREQSDSVQMYLDDRDIKPGGNNFKYLADLYSDYKTYCFEDGYKPVGKKNMRKRLEVLSFVCDRKEHGVIVYTS